VNITPYEDDQFGLTTGFNSVAEAIRSNYPNLSDADVSYFTNQVLEEVGRRMHSGEHLAFIKEDEDGNGFLTILALELLSGADENEQPF
jgi:hypothetical protein